MNDTIYIILTSLLMCFGIIFILIREIINLNKINSNIIDEFKMKIFIECMLSWLIISCLGMINIEILTKEPDTKIYTPKLYKNGIWYVPEGK